jgi:homogentisate 1,2-dioxygenase
MELTPARQSNTMAFMLETRFPQHVTKYAASSPTLQRSYIECWDGIKKHFDGKKR